MRTRTFLILTLWSCSDGATPPATDAAAHDDAAMQTDAAMHLDAATQLDATMQLDARMIEPPDAGALPDPCAARPTYGRATLTEQMASGEGSSADRVNLEASGRLGAGRPSDQLSLLLYSATGVFGASLAPGTYAISGAELNFSTCGLCVLLDANWSPPAPPEMVYFATGGTVEIVEVGAQLRATLRDVTFEHVTIDGSEPFASRPVGDGCVSRIDEVSFGVRIN